MQVTEQELAEQFAAMEDEPLLDRAAEADSLTELARTVLVAEIRRRGLQVPHSETVTPAAHEAQRWVTVARFRDLSAAIVARSALEAAEIECFLRDENLVRMDWQISNFIGGMRLDVLEGDWESARDVLAGISAGEDPPSDTGPVLASETCPHCGSTDIRRQAKRRGLSLAALLLMSVPIPTGPQEWRCQSCGYRWPDVSFGSGR